MKEKRREPEVPEERVPVKECFDGLARITSKELAHCFFYKSESGRKLGEKCSYAQRQVENQPSKRSQKEWWHKCSGHVENYTTIGLRISGYEPPKSSSILRKSSNILKPIRCVKFTKAVVRHANFRDQNPSLGMICPGDPHQRNPNTPKFEDRSQSETKWQEQGAREAA